jgi:LPXTG-motif cell wall-anchored protein
MSDPTHTVDTHYAAAVATGKLGDRPMTFATRRLAACAVLIVMLASLATAGVAMAATSTITQQDCAQGTIKDKSGNTISQARCQALVGKNVQLASTGFDVRPLLGAGVLLIAGAAAFGFRRRSSHRLA